MRQLVVPRSGEKDPSRRIPRASTVSGEFINRKYRSEIFLSELSTHITETVQPVYHFDFEKDGTAMENEKAFANRLVELFDSKKSPAEVRNIPNPLRVSVFFST